MGNRCVVKQDRSGPCPSDTVHLPPPLTGCHRQGKGTQRGRGALHHRRHIHHYFCSKPLWQTAPEGSVISALTASAAHLRTGSYLEVCKIRGTLRSEDILSSIALKGSRMKMDNMKGLAGIWGEVTMCQERSWWNVWQLMQSWKDSKCLSATHFCGDVS